MTSDVLKRKIGHIYAHIADTDLSAVDYNIEFTRGCEP